MIEINLVPDIKQEFLRSQRLRARVISGSILVCLASAGVVVLLGAMLVAQNVRDVLADSSIDTEYKKLVGNNKDLNDVVTIQNQLANISTLNDNKLMTSRTFDLLSAVNPTAPNNVQMTQITVDPAKKTINVQGVSANGFNSVDALKKTILNTNVAYTGNGQDGTAALSDTVNIGKTSLGQDSTGKQVLRFELNFIYPKELFSNTVSNVRVVTPTGTVDVTDSHTRVPDSLFTQPASDVTGSNK
jgi:hypothetical protein